MPITKGAEPTMYNDADLKEAVLEELAWEPSVTAAHIGVAARDGVITLTGHVHSFVEKHAAECAVRRLKGVKAVAEDIEVRLPGDTRHDDGDIAQAALSKLAWNSSVPRDAIKIVVEKGWVTITGDVEWHFQSDAVMQDVRTLWGVVGVTNDIRIKPNVNTAILSGDITRALHRAWNDPRSIKVTADGGKVKLTGTVHSWSDRMLAATTAWAAPGATAVENDLIIV